MRSVKLVVYGCWRCRWWREIKNILWGASECPHLCIWLQKFVLFGEKIESSGGRTRSLQYITCGRVTGWAAFGVFSRHLFLLGKILEWYSNILRMAQEVNCQHSLRSNIWIIVSSKLVKLTLKGRGIASSNVTLIINSLLRTVTCTSHFSGSIICGNSMKSMRILQSTCRAPFLCLMALIYLAQVSIPILKVWFGPVRVFWRDHTGICMHSYAGFIKLRSSVQSFTWGQLYLLPYW